MNAITAFMEDMDFSKILPKIGNLLKDIRFWLNFLMVAAPMAVLAMGLWYYFLPTKEANYKLGFRTYFGMGSVEAWKFTQRLAGWIWMILGGAGTLISLVLMVLDWKKDVMRLALHSLIWLLIFAVLAAVSYVVVSIMVAARFDAQGEPKKKEN